mgnify:CR=1 FL=1
MAMLYSAKCRPLSITGGKVRKIRHCRIRIAILLCTNCKQFVFGETGGTVFLHGKSFSDDKNYLKKQYICIVDSKYAAMTKTQSVQLFEERKVRTVWDDDAEKWYFSVVDVVGVLTDSIDATAYWRKLKQRLKEEGNETVTNCHGLKMPAADGKMRMTDVADTEQLFRLIQSIPSPKAEPFKQWMAQVASDRLDQMQDPELSIQQAVTDYRRLGYDEKWIKGRLRSIEVRNDLTDEWHRCGVHDPKDFAFLTAILTKEWSGKTPSEYKRYKGLKKENLRDNMTNIELALNTLAEASTTELSKMQNPTGVKESTHVAQKGGRIAKNARAELEKQLGHSVISSAKAIDYITPKELDEDIER